METSAQIELAPGLSSLMVPYECVENSSVPSSRPVGYKAAREDCTVAFASLEWMVNAMLQAKLYPMSTNNFFEPRLLHSTCSESAETGRYNSSISNERWDREVVGNGC